MAMSNSTIITAYKAENNIPLDTPLYTFAVWKSKGYKVKRGEASKHRVQMWKYAQGKKKADTETQGTPHGHCYMKTMYLFEQGQVEKIKA